MQTMQLVQITRAEGLSPKAALEKVAIRCCIADFHSKHGAFCSWLQLHTFSGVPIVRGATHCLLHARLITRITHKALVCVNK